MAAGGGMEFISLEIFASTVSAIVVTAGGVVHALWKAFLKRMDTAEKRHELDKAWLQHRVETLETQLVNLRRMQDD